MIAQPVPVLNVSAQSIVKIRWKAFVYGSLFATNNCFIISAERRRFWPRFVYVVVITG